MIEKNKEKFFLYRHDNLHRNKLYYISCSYGLSIKKTLDKIVEEIFSNICKDKKEGT